jgi:hypothetical protein
MKGDTGTRSDWRSTQPGTWLANAGVLWGAAGAIVLTVVFGNLPGRGRLSAVLQDSCHAPAFAALALIGFLLLARRNALRSGSLRALLLRCLSVITLAVVLGAATEGLQWLLGRDADPEDVVSDFTGATGMAALWLYVHLRSRGGSPTVARGICLLVCLAALLWWAGPLAECARAYWNRYRQFPVLAQFRAERDLYFVTSSGSQTRIVAPGGLFLRLDSGAWPGLTLSEPMPDWRGYRTLLLDLGNPDDRPLPLQLRIDDGRPNTGRAENRFNTSLSLAPRVRATLRVPLQDIARGPRTRALDLGDIVQLILFRDGGAAGQELLVYGIALQ